MNIIWLIKKGGETLLGSKDLSLELADWEEAFTDNIKPGDLNLLNAIAQKMDFQKCMDFIEVYPHNSSDWNEIGDLIMAVITDAAENDREEFFLSGRPKLHHIITLLKMGKDKEEIIPSLF